MKTSNILLLATVSLFLLVTLCSNLILKKQFDAIDKNDPYYGFSREPLKPFHYIRLQGKGFGLTEIAPGAKAEVRMITDAKYLEWVASGDTLIVTYKADWNQGYQYRGSTFGARPSVYITTPQLKGIISDNIKCKVSNYKFGDLFVDQKGDGIFLNGSSIEKLTARVRANGYLKLDAKTAIGTADVEVRDSSGLSADKDVFGVLNVKIDSSATISMPGSMLKKMLHP
jgi:hypothetical protein